MLKMGASETNTEFSKFNGWYLADPFADYLLCRALDWQP